MSTGENKNKILLVEDDPLMIRLYERVLRFNELDVEVVFNGKEAITKLSSIGEKPALILLDIMMPKLNGFDVLRYLQGNPQLNSIPVITLTNLADESDEKKAKELGATLYFVKSEHSVEELVSRIKEFTK